MEEEKSAVEVQIEELQKSMAIICDEIAVLIVNNELKKALDLALQTKRELVDDSQSNN